MKDLSKLNIEYMGFKVPETEGEVEIEILGLESAIHAIRHRIFILKQSSSVAKHMNDEGSVNEKAVEAESDTKTK